MPALIAIPLASALSYFQAIVLGFLQGVTELFPISSLGHTVLFPTLFGWNELVKAQSQSESFWLAFVVMLHVGSAIGLLIYYWRDWVQIIGAFFHTLRHAPDRDEHGAPGLADRPREHPRRGHRPGARAPAAHAHGQARDRGDLPDGQRSPAVRRRALPPARGGARTGGAGGRQARRCARTGHARVPRGVRHRRGSVNCAGLPASAATA